MIFNCGRAATRSLAQRLLVFDDEDAAAGFYQAAEKDS
jgi:hypothetical protein